MQEVQLSTVMEQVEHELLHGSQLFVTLFSIYVLVLGQEALQSLLKKKNPFTQDKQLVSVVQVAQGDTQETQVIGVEVVSGYIPIIH